ncbi:MAG: protein kinase [Pseudomonadota bacterium]
MVQSAHTNDQFPDELAPGTKLLSGQYTIMRFLNSGGFGITYLAKDSLERTIVIKECFPEAICRRSQTAVRPRSQSHTSSYEALVKSFEKEARNQSKLVHPNIAGVHQVFRDNETAYMAIDFIEGKDLLDTIEERKTIPPEEVEQLLRSTLEAVGFIHSEGMLHRDISPDNILINQDGEPMIIDFGAARESAAKSDRAMSMLRVVKEGYSPQEFYLQGAEQDQSSDLYALAATFYHVIKGAAPQDSQTRLAALAQNGKDCYEPLEGAVEGYPVSFLRAIDRALSVPPEDRFQSVQEWQDAIEERMPIEAKPEPVAAVDFNDKVAVNSKAPRKRSNSMLMIALIVAGVIGGAGYYFSQGGEADQDVVAIAATQQAAPQPATDEEPESSGATAQESEPEPRPAAAEPEVESVASEPATTDSNWIAWTGPAVDLPFATVTTSQPQGRFSMVSLVRSDLDPATTDWLKSGTIIYSVNGHLVVDDNSIIRAIQSREANPESGEILVDMRVRTEEDSPVSEKNLTLQTGKVVELTNGVQFITVTNGNGKWISKVLRAPASAKSVRVGDIVVSETASQISIEGENGITQLFEELSNTGAELALLTIARNGELQSVDLPLTH